MCNGIKPPSSLACTSAPASSKNSTISFRPNPENKTELEIFQRVVFICRKLKLRICIYHALNNALMTAILTVCG